MLPVSHYGETPSSTFTSGTGCCMNRTVTQSWLIYLQIFEVRAELTKTVVVKVFEILESARIYVSIWSTLGTKGKHVTRCEPQIFSEQSQPLNAKLSQLTPLLQERLPFSSATSGTIISKSGLATSRKVFNLRKGDRTIWEEAYYVSQKEHLATDNRWSQCNTAADY